MPPGVRVRGHYGPFSKVSTDARLALRNSCPVVKVFICVSYVWADTLTMCDLAHNSFHGFFGFSLLRVTLQAFQSNPRTLDINRGMATAHSCANNAYPYAWLKRWKIYRLYIYVELKYMSIQPAQSESDSRPPVMIFRGIKGSERHRFSVIFSIR